MFVSHLSNKTKQLSQDDFERTLLTLVYLAQQMVSSMTNYQQDMWAESFVSLYEIIKQDLMRWTQLKKTKQLSVDVKAEKNIFYSNFYRENTSTE